MSPKEQIFTHDSFDITYKYRKALQDRRHLLIVFSSGFGGTYDFEGNIANSIRTAILWIKDAENTYYIRDTRGFKMESAVHSLIEKIRLDSGLEKRHLIFLGASKGATGALYHGLKYDYPNIIAAVPRMRIGAANLESRQDILAGLTSTLDPESVRSLDRLLLDQLESDWNLARNLYLISSTSDPQYKTEISPYLHLYSKYDNFNFVVTNSPLVLQHSDVTRYNVPIITSIVSALGEGAIPRYGWVHNGSGAFLSGAEVAKASVSNTQRSLVTQFTSLDIKNGLLYPKGVGFFRGTPAHRYDSLQRHLLLKGTDDAITRLQLGGLIDHSVSSRFFENEYIDYSVATFASPREEGFDISRIQYGIYDIGLEISRPGATDSSYSSPLDGRPIKSAYKDALYYLKRAGSGLKLIKREIVSSQAHDSFFDLGITRIQNDLLHIQGYYAIKGVPAENWGDLNFYLVMVNKADGAIESIPLASSSRPGISEKVGDEWNDYSKSYFATPNYAGISLKKVPLGVYDVLISAASSTGVYTRQTTIQIAAVEVRNSFADTNSIQYRIATH